MSLNTDNDELIDEGNKRVNTLLRKFKNPRTTVPVVDLRDCSLLDTLPNGLCVEHESQFYNRVTKLNLRNNIGFDVSLIAHMCHNLVDLNIGDMKLRELPSCLANFSQLSKLNVSNNELSELPDWMSDPSKCLFQKSLTLLTLENNQLRQLSHGIGLFENLEHLQLHGNELQSLPYEITKLTKLSNFLISKNKLREDALKLLDQQPTNEPYLIFKSFPNMKFFGVHLNKNITHIPEEIGNWKQMEYLKLTGCSLHYFPMHVIVENMKKLKCLLLNKNQLGDDSFINPKTQELVSLEMLTNLSQLDLRVNNNMTLLHPYLYKSVLHNFFPKLKKFRHSFAECVIPDRLYIGDMHCIVKKKHIEDLNITHILSVLDVDNLPIPPLKHIKQLHIDILDEVNVDISTHFDTAIKFIESALEEHPNNRVLVHCVVGKSRSASCVLAYLMKSMKMNYVQAFTFLDSIRSGGIAPNEAFVAQLKEYEALLLQAWKNELSDQHTFSSEQPIRSDNQMIHELLNMGFSHIEAVEALVITNYRSVKYAVEYITKQKENPEYTSHMNINLLLQLLAAKTRDRESRMGTFTIPSEELKMVLLVRDDLNMTKGKIASQCCHAALGAYKSIIQGDNVTHKKWLNDWENSLETKVGLRVNSEDQLLNLETKAQEAGLNTHTVIDKGRTTQIESDTRTTLAIGPGPVSLINQVTGRLKLL